MSVTDNKATIRAWFKELTDGRVLEEPIAPNLVHHRAAGKDQDWKTLHKILTKDDGRRVKLLDMLAEDD